MARRTLLALAALTIGCGGGGSGDVKRPMGTLKGKLTMQGTPLPAKTGLAFQHASTGTLYYTLTDESGAFEVTKPVKDMLAGRYDVSVTPSSLRDESGAEAAEAALEPPKPGAKKTPEREIPGKYRQSHLSGLSFELNEGPNNRTFDLQAR